MPSSRSLPDRLPVAPASRAELLTSPAFLMALAVLVVNDWLLKPQFGNWLTGKLSDLAGLVAFALFWTALFPRWRRAVFTATAISFVVWKSPLSEAPLAAWNALGIWPLQRVVDYTDWLALAALLPAYRLSASRGARGCRDNASFRRRLAAVGTAGIAMAAFLATSVAPPSYSLQDSEAYRVPGDGEQVRQGLEALGLYIVTSQVAAETLSVYIRQPPERFILVRVEVLDATEQWPESILRLLGVSAIGPQPSDESVHRAFRQQVVEPLRARWREAGSADPSAPGSPPAPDPPRED